jgi:hypothetical protein
VATPRQRFFPVHTRLYRESWPREQKLALVMLGLLMTDRWAADRLTDEQATRARLSSADLLEITGCGPEEAVKLLRSISRDVSLRVKALANGYCEVQWPKFLESLRSRNPYNARELPPNYPQNAPSSSSSSTKKKNEEKRKTKKKNPESADADPPGPGPLSRMLKGAADDERDAWLDTYWLEIWAAAEVEAPSAEKLFACQKRIAFARWRAYLGGARQFRGIGEQRAKQARIDAWDREHGQAARQLAAEEAQA